MKRKIALMTALSLMTMGLAAAPALADDDDRYEGRWDDRDRWDRDHDWDHDDDDHRGRDRHGRWDHDDRWRDDRWDRGRHYGWRHKDRYDRYGVTQRQAVAIAQYRGMRRISDIDFDDGRWKIEGWSRRGEMEIEISARTARILDIDYD